MKVWIFFFGSFCERNVHCGQPVGNEFRRGNSMTGAGRLSAILLQRARILQYSASWLSAPALPSTLFFFPQPPSSSCSRKNFLSLQQKLVFLARGAHATVWHSAPEDPKQLYGGREGRFVAVG